MHYKFLINYLISVQSYALLFAQILIISVLINFAFKFIPS